MVDAWVAVVAAIATGVMGYLGHWVQARIATKDNEDTLAEARRAEALGHFRWAAERAVSDEETQRRLGADQLEVLVNDPNLTKGDLRRVRAAIRSALAPRLGP